MAHVRKELTLGFCQVLSFSSCFDEVFFDPFTLGYFLFELLGLLFQLLNVFLN